MKRLKKGIALIVSMVMMLSMSSCGKENVSNGMGERSTRESIIATLENRTTEDSTIGTVTTDDVKTTEEAPINVDPEQEKAFKQFEDDYFKEALEASFVGYHSKVKDGSTLGLEKPEPKWSDVDWSDAVMDESKAQAEEWMNRLQAIDRDSLNETDRISYDLYMEDFEDELKMYGYNYYKSAFSPCSGFQEGFSSTFTDYLLETKEDVEDYLSLLESSPAYFDKLIEYEKDRADHGFVMNDNNLDSVIEQCNTFTEEKENHFMIELFNLKIDEADFLTAEEKTAYKAKNKELVLNDIIPMYEKLATEMEALKGKNTNKTGLAGYEKGKDYYALVMKQKTSSTKTPEEALELLYYRLNNFMPDMVALYQKDPDGYMYYVEHYDTLTDDVDKNMTVEEMLEKLMVVDTDEYPAIDKIPYTLSYFEKPLEKIMERTLAYYKLPRVDVPTNVIRVNGGHTEDLWATIAHEGFPGHMYQMNYYLTTNPSNLRSIEFFLGYVEGWAKYIEYRSYEKIDYPDTDSDETVGKLAALNSEINMLVFGILDIEVNYNGWTVEDVEKWFGEQGYDTSVAEQIFDIVAGDPGLYQSYVLGYYEMKGLRDKAEQALGDKFDAVEFHRVILETGPVQYDILERQVDKYIQENQ